MEVNDFEILMTDAAYLSLACSGINVLIQKQKQQI